MSKPQKRSNKRGPYQILESSEGQQLSVQLRGLHPSALYSASWVQVDRTGSSVHFKFGQRLDGTLYSRVDVRMAVNHFMDAVGGSRDFLQQLVGLELVGAGAEEVDTEATSNVPNGRYMLEHATVMSMAYSGGQAEVDFTWIPSGDINRALHTKADDYRGPRPVVTIVMTLQELRYVGDCMLKISEAIEAEVKS